MNNVYFRCETCKTYIDAGYRWCYLQLEKPGIVTEERPIAVDAVLGHATYWSGVDPSHRVVYGQFDPLFENNAFLDWLCEDDDGDLLPRTFVERLGFERWEQVHAMLKAAERQPWWWHDPEMVDIVRVHFETLVKRKMRP